MLPSTDAVPDNFVNSDINIHGYYKAITITSQIFFSFALCFYFVYNRDNGIGRRIYMAFDGVTIANIVKELNDTIVGGKINKIAQPEADELILTIKNNRTQYRLLISASASLPLIYFTDKNKVSPLTAPNFCMLLRKHVGSGKITAVTQPGLERVIEIKIEHLNELGDLCFKTLVVEIMGKHSNIIFLNEERMILDSIKHVSLNMSSVREVLPGRDYFIPQTQDKKDPLTITEEEFYRTVYQKPVGTAKAIYSSLTGLSPIAAEEICTRALVHGSSPTEELSDQEKERVYRAFAGFMEDIRKGHFTPNIVYSESGEPVEFGAVPLTQYTDFAVKEYDSISQVLEQYYAQKNIITRMRQKSADLRKIVQTALERNNKKYDLQLKQLKDTEKREKYRIYGELLNTYGYELTGGEKSFTCLNYYTNEEITIPLDTQLSAKDNAKKHFDKYNKLKRTYEALTDLTKETKAEIDHLESISSALDIALAENDLVQIKEELTEYGYIKKRRSSDKKPKITSKPFHYISSDGFHIYVGKNNYQNEELTFKLATGNDWWFHAKGIPGSHVIVKTKGRADLPDRLFEEAGSLAAYYSKGRDNDKVEIDYIQKKNIKKVAGAAPGFVIYHTNYSLVASPECGLNEVE